MRTTSARELREYEAFSRIEPFGDVWRAVGLVCATIFNSQRTTDSKWFEPGDFVNFGEEQVEPEQPPQTKNDVSAAFAAAGCRIVLAP